MGALFRVLPTAGTARSREERLRRFLENRRLDPRGVTDGLARFIFGRRGRLLLAFCIAYCLALVLGLSSEAQRARADLEILRRQPRHGTRRTLSVLSVAMQMLVHPRWRRLAYERLHRIAARLAAGRRTLQRPPPQLEELSVQVA